MVSPEAITDKGVKKKERKKNTHIFLCKCANRAKRKERNDGWLEHHLVGLGGGELLGVHTRVAESNSLKVSDKGGCREIQRLDESRGEMRVQKEN